MDLHRLGCFTHVPQQDADIDPATSQVRLVFVGSRLGFGQFPKDHLGRPVGVQGFGQLTGEFQVKADALVTVCKGVLDTAVGGVGVGQLLEDC